MSFQIEVDKIAYEGEPSRVGRLFNEGELRYGPFQEHLPLPATDGDGQPLPRIPFRLFDDDGELYYEGWLHDDWNCDNQLTALRWAEGDSGCTYIKVKRGDEWKQEIG